VGSAFGVGFTTNRARVKKALRQLPTYLGRVVREMGRKIAGDDRLETIADEPVGIDVTGRQRMSR
jgi:hypothetical protein